VERVGSKPPPPPWSVRRGSEMQMQMHATKGSTYVAPTVASWVRPTDGNASSTQEALWLRLAVPVVAPCAAAGISSAWAPYMLATSCPPIRPPRRFFVRDQQRHGRIGARLRDNGPKRLCRPREGVEHLRMTWPQRPKINKGLSTTSGHQELYRGMMRLLPCYR
jgi:hypothetical protein